jgi:hypothetical protein
MVRKRAFLSQDQHRETLMTKPITIDLPDDLREYAEAIARSTNRTLESVLIGSLRAVLGGMGGIDPADLPDMPDETLWGVSTLVRDGLVVRGLGCEGRNLSSGLLLFWQAAKQALYGATATPPRKVY